VHRAGADSERLCHELRQMDLSEVRLPGLYPAHLVGYAEEHDGIEDANDNCGCMTPSTGTAATAVGRCRGRAGRGMSGTCFCARDAFI